MVGTIDPKYMIGEVAARHGIKIDAKDPIMAVVTLNELAMMQYTASVEERIEGAGKQFERAASRLQELAASVLADEVGKAGIALRSEIQTDIHDARLNAN